MPRPGPRRPVVAVRVDPDHQTWLTEQAGVRGVSQGAIIRDLINHAIQAAKRQSSKGKKP